MRGDRSITQVRGSLFLAGRQPSRAKGAALNYPSQPHGRALTHDVPPLAPPV